MQALLKFSWLIPGAPIFGSVFVAVLLISFNRTINRLTKPISFILGACLAISFIISLLLLFNNVVGEVFSGDLNLVAFNLPLSLYLDALLEKIFSIISLLILLAIICSYYLLERKKGYVRYLLILSGFTGIIFLVLLDGLVSIPLN